MEYLLYLVISLLQTHRQLWWQKNLRNRSTFGNIRDKII